MKKFFLSLAVFVMALCANAQTNQYFWYQGNLMMGNPIAQIDSVTFGEGEPVDTLHILLPRTIIKEVHDTVYITIHDTVCPDAIPEGALAGEFSVSATKKVRISKGNLQYQASTDTWRFAENQWDCVGEGNSSISPTYSEWIDLFGWGTGNNPTNTSSSDDDYQTFVDWGINVISNGGNTSNIWRTLTKDEWVYLCNTRAEASSKYGAAKVNGIPGVVILPDNWTLPNDCAFTAAMTSSWNDWSLVTSTNIYDASQWSKMESAGAVFLPAAGHRSGTGVYYFGSYGNYWSSTPNGAESAYHLCFRSAFLNPMDDSNHNAGFTVRLVQDIE